MSRLSSTEEVSLVRFEDERLEVDEDSRSSLYQVSRLLKELVLTEVL